MRQGKNSKREESGDSGERAGREERVVIVGREQEGRKERGVVGVLYIALTDLVVPILFDNSMLQFLQTLVDQGLVGLSSPEVIDHLLNHRPDVVLIHVCSGTTYRA